MQPTGGTRGLPGADGTPPVVLVLPDAGDRPLLRTALALARGLGAPLIAWTFHEPGEDLPEALRAPESGPTEADRAIDRLVRAATHGTRVIPERIPVGPEALRDASERLRVCGDGALLVLGRVRGGPRPDVPAARALAEAHAGPIAVVFDRPAAFSAVLAITPPDGSPSRALFARVAYALERSYPVSWWHGATAASDLDLAFRDANRRQLILACSTAPGEPGPVALLMQDRDLPTSSPVAILLPPEPGRESLVARLLGSEPQWRADAPGLPDATGGAEQDGDTPAGPGDEGWEDDEDGDEPAEPEDDGEDEDSDDGDASDDAWEDDGDGDETGDSVDDDTDEDTEDDLDDTGDGDEDEDDPDDEAVGPDDD